MPVHMNRVPGQAGRSSGAAAGLAVPGKRCKAQPMQTPPPPASPFLCDPATHCSLPHHGIRRAAQGLRQQQHAARSSSWPPCAGQRVNHAWLALRRRAAAVSSMSYSAPLLPPIDVRTVRATCGSRAAVDAAACEVCVRGACPALAVACIPISGSRLMGSGGVRLYACTGLVPRSAGTVRHLHPAAGCARPWTEGRQDDPESSQEPGDSSIARSSPTAGRMPAPGRRTACACLCWPAGR